MTRPATTHDDGAPTPRKATLFCRECDHSSPVDGDWVVQSRDRCVAYVCPDCGITLTKRPRSNERSDRRATVGPVAAWRRTIRTSATVWRASVDLGFTSLTALLRVHPTAGVR
ncbi:hypothetical protein [Natrinema salaciae]|uniref:DUF8106 domain-containing protein n=1 Tax=Natrinema salaciae TaxID=1186196 RepID=A0A1H9SFW8_9EURY|nr:hypothetical protein [Natrinema salaciae]SER83902.1 hypothetical protein SAMN04489841_4716 [Natrinema salaciae]